MNEELNKKILEYKKINNRNNKMLILLLLILLFVCIVMVYVRFFGWLIIGFKLK